MEKREFEIETLTPLFCHGEDKSVVEMRATSIKGLLRYWWRIMKINENENETFDLKDENEIFGSTEKRSSFKLQIITVNEQLFQNTKIKEIAIQNPGIKYAWMNGPVYRDRNRDGDQYRTMIYPARYKIIFNFYDKVNEDILKSFYYLIKYGGIGGKNRRGAGKFIFLNNGLNYTKNYNRLKLLECNQKFDSWQNAINFLGSVYWIYRAKNKHRDDKYYLGSAKFREKDRIPSKVIFEIFKNNDKYQTGYLLLYDEEDKNFSEQLDIFKNYLLDKLYSQYLNDVIRNNKKDFLRKTYDKLKNYIAQLGNFSFTEVKNG